MPAQLPALRLVQAHDSVAFHIGDESLVVRGPETDYAHDDDQPMPNNAADTLPRHPRTAPKPTQSLWFALL